MRLFIIYILFVLSVFICVNLSLYATPLLFNKTFSSSYSFSSSSSKIPDTSQILDELVVLGTRSVPRTQTESPVAVDVFKVSQLIKNVPQPDVGSILNYSEPSFTSTAQMDADGTDHVNPAALRGLNPDQTLVLLNGKRRHNSALTYVNFTFGRGSVGTDLNAIPAIAIGKIEVLRDGAAAQYGSDAIAGVININLRKNLGTTVLINAGANITSFQTYTEATKGNYLKGENPQYVKNTVVDGQNYQIGINHGFSLGKKGGYLNLSFLGNYRGHTNRSGEATGSITTNSSLARAVNPTSVQDNVFLEAHNITRKNIRNRAGQSDFSSGQFFFNGAIPVNKSGSSEIYFFGGLGFRNGIGSANYRKPGLGVVIYGQYPTGILPLITTDIWDPSLAAGYKTTINKWEIDVANVSGVNSFVYEIKNTENSTTGGLRNIQEAGGQRIDSTQSTFKAGGLFFFQNVASVDIVRQFPILKGFNLAFGGLYRYERYRQTKGETASWADFNLRDKRNLNRVDINGDTSIPPTSYSPPLLAARSYTYGGAQGFVGIPPENQFSVDRHNLAFYVDLEQNFTKALLLNVAGRYEYYTDFGHNVSWKVASRIKFGNHIALRGAVSTGFRAPSLQQRYFSFVGAFITSTGQFHAGIFQNESEIAKALGINSLRPEISLSASGGLTFNYPRLKITLDGYYIRIKNRVILTGGFGGGNNPTVENILQQANVAEATFFTNGLDTRTFGADWVSTYQVPVPRFHSLHFSLAANYTQTQQIGKIHISNLLKNQSIRFLSPRNLGFLFTAIPRYKVFFTLNYTYKKFTLFARESLFGQTLHIDDNWNEFYRKYDEKGKDVTSSPYYVYKQTIPHVFVTDISFSYDVVKFLRITLGVNNLFDTYTSLIKLTKGKFYEIQVDPTKPDYGNIAKQGVHGTELGLANNDMLTRGLSIGNQYNYSRWVSAFGMNGRYLFVRLLFQL